MCYSRENGLKQKLCKGNTNNVAVKHNNSIHKNTVYNSGSNLREDLLTITLFIRDLCTFTIANHPTDPEFQAQVCGHKKFTLGAGGELHEH